MFGPTSRYRQVPEATHEAPDGTLITYKLRRWPPSGEGSLYGSTQLRPGERLDQLSTRALRDPGQFWRLCDANGVMDPFELVDEPGRRVRVPLTHGPEQP